MSAYHALPIADEDNVELLAGVVNQLLTQLVNVLFAIIRHRLHQEQCPSRPAFMRAAI